MYISCNLLIEVISVIGNGAIEIQLSWYVAGLNFGMTSTRSLRFTLHRSEVTTMSRHDPSYTKCGSPLNWPSLAVLLGYQRDMNGWLSLLYCIRQEARQALLLLESDAVSGLLGQGIPRRMWHEEIIVLITLIFFF